MTTITAANLAGLAADITFIDEIVESQLPTVTSPGGVITQTLKGRLAGLGMRTPVAYAGGLTFTNADYTAVVLRDGVYYSPLPSALPFSTSGTWASDDDAKFRILPLTDQGVVDAYGRALSEKAYQYSTAAATQSHVGATTGFIVRGNFYDDDNTPGSGASHAHTGVTTAGKAGDWPNADGKFYDADGKQFDAVGDANVGVYGAVGNGTTNDTAAIVAAIASDKNVVFCDPFTYLVSNNVLEARSNTKWTVQKGSTIMNVDTAVVYNVIQCNNVFNFEISGGGTLLGYVENNAAANAITLNITEGGNILIADLNFTGSNGECIYIGAGGGPTNKSKNVTVRDCVIKEARRNGIAVSDVDGVLITGCTISDTFNPDHTEICAGIDIEPIPGQTSNNVIVTGNTLLRNYGSGIAVYTGLGAGFLGSNISLTNNLLQDNCLATPTGSDVWPRAAIDATNVIKLNCSNNQVSNAQSQGGISIDACRESVISGNLITCDASTGTYPTADNNTQPQFLSGLTLAAVTDSTVTGNTIKIANYHGIYLFQSTRTAVNNNVVNNTQEIGIASESNNDCIIDSNIVFEANKSGILAINSNNEYIVGNTIIDCNRINATGTNIAGAAIVVTYSGANTVAGMRVQDNTVRTPNFTPTYGLKMGGSNVSGSVVTGNDFRGTYYTSEYGDVGANVLNDVDTSAFSAAMGTSLTNVTGDGTVYGVVFDNALVNIGGYFNTTTGAYTAPRTGIYRFDAQVWISENGAGTTTEITLVTPNRSYASGFAGAVSNVTLSVFADLDAGESASITIATSGGAKVVDIYAAPGAMTTRFSGGLVA